MTSAGGSPMLPANHDAAREEMMTTRALVLGGGGPVGIAWESGLIAGFHAGVKRLANPHQYPVGLEQRLHERRTELVMRARRRGPGEANP